MKVTPRITVLLSLIAAAFVGCSTVQPLATPSGRPEVTINSTDREKIKSAVINEFMNAGFVLVSEGDYSIQFSKKFDGFGGVMYQAMLGNSYSSQPIWIARVNFASVGQSTRMMGQAVVKMQNAFGREDVNDMTQGKSGQQLQVIFNRIKNQVESI